MPFRMLIAASQERVRPRSRLGEAVGLMQIMPGTGEWIAGHMKIKNYSRETLKDAKP